MDGKLLDESMRLRNGLGGRLVLKVSGFDIDLEPVQKNEVLMNPQRYAYPTCAITVRFSALMKLADYPCLLTNGSGRR